MSSKSKQCWVKFGKTLSPERYRAVEDFFRKEIDPEVLKLRQEGEAKRNQLELSGVCRVENFLYCDQNPNNEQCKFFKKQKGNVSREMNSYQGSKKFQALSKVE